ncbi:hypothetical protein SLE2022_405690 [Rubroshorea leprosula]
MRHGPVPCSGVRRHLRLHDLAGRARRLALGQRVDMLHARHDLAPHRVLVVEEGGVVEADEELAVGRVRIAGARHRADAADVRLPGELGLEVGLLRSRHAGARRIAALRHKTGDHAVEDDAVVEALARQLLDPRDMAGGEIGAQPDRDVARLEREDQRVLGIVGHAILHSFRSAGPRRPYPTSPAHIRPPPVRRIAAARRDPTGC